jgi:hypothetical protein
LPLRWGQRCRLPARWNVPAEPQKPEKRAHGSRRLLAARVAALRSFLTDKSRALGRGERGPVGWFWATTGGEAALDHVALALAGAPGEACHVRTMGVIGASPLCERWDDQPVLPEMGAPAVPEEADEMPEPLSSLRQAAAPVACKPREVRA